MPHTVEPAASFVGIGALKAGTTFLDAVLRAHPDVAMPVRLKETNYFSAHYDRGLEWYDSLFPAGGTIRGEISPAYATRPEAAARVAATYPQAKLLFIMREPVKRLVSQFRHFRQETGYAKDFDTFVAEHPNAVLASCYHECLQPWLERFERAQFHFMILERFSAEPDAEFDRLCGFLGVAPGVRPAELRTPANVTGVPRFPRLYVAAKRAGRALDGPVGLRIVDLVKRAGLAGRLRGRPPAGSSEVEVALPVRRRLEADTDRLRELVPDISRYWAATESSGP